MLKQLQWPYSYDSCDVGTLPGQVYPGTQTPLAAVENGDPEHDNLLVRGYSRVHSTYKSANSHACFIMQSLLPGQRLSACTCPGESHPGPLHEDGSFVGRSAPEIDLFEALIAGKRGQVSQSAQWAPFNAEYAWQNTSSNLYIADPTATQLNTYIGGTCFLSLAHCGVPDFGPVIIGRGISANYQWLGVHKLGLLRT
jgi:beta-glucanase (GH16 family)